MITAQQAKDLVLNTKAKQETLLKRLEYEITNAAMSGKSKIEVHFDPDVEPHTCQKLASSVFVVNIADKLRMNGFKVSTISRHYEARGSGNTLYCNYLEVNW